MTLQDLPVPQDSGQVPRTCWACDHNTPTTPWPVLHPTARHHSHPTTHLPPQAYPCVAPWFHRTDTKPTVAWDPDHKPQWLFTTGTTRPRPDPTGIAMRYSMYERGRTRKHEHPYYPLYHSCHTPEHLTQTITCRHLNPDTAYILHYIYSYITQGQQEEGLIAVSPHAIRIISQGVGVFATPILQPTTLVAHLTTGPAIYTYRASPRGSTWRQASSTGLAAPAPRATTHWGGDAVGKRLQLRLLSDALTGEWRDGEAGEGQGIESREPGGLHHQAGGVS